MRDLTRLYDALQERILTLIEEGHTDLQSQIEYWRLERKAQVVLFYAKKEGIRHLGLQPVPAAIASEVKGKQAIAMNLLLRSLARSPYADEQWTLGDTGVELVLATEPKNAFKKHGYEVLVMYDHSMNNSYPYTNWDSIYYQDENEDWIKVPGQVDYNGMYYEEADGTKAYFTLFADNAHRYGQTGEWTVQYKNKTIYPPSSRTSGGPSEEVLVISDSGSDASEPGPVISPGRESTDPYSESAYPQAGPSTSNGQAAVGAGRRLGQGEQGPEPPVKRAKADSTGGRRPRRRGHSPRRRGRGGGGGGDQSPVPAEEVGRRHRTVTERGLTRLGRLQAEARDPPIISVQGCANSLKCWRNRLPKLQHLYTNATTVFHWVLPLNTECQGRVLIAFADTTQRTKFLAAVTIPRNCTYALGTLNAL